MSCRMKHGKAGILQRFIIFQSSYNQSVTLKHIARDMAAMTLEMSVIGQPVGNFFCMFGCVRSVS